MKNYLNLLQQILDEGTWQANRTGVDAISIPGTMLKFDLAEGFPAMTTKKLYFDAVKGELLGFLRGYDNAADFRKLGCKIWDQNANENKAWLENSNRKGDDDLGRIYSKQWTSWRGKAVASVHEVSKGLDTHREASIRYDELNQINIAINTIKKDPTNRRIIVNAWRPDELDQMALPPCHILFQFICNVEKNELNLCWFQRSNDTFIGSPFNIASYALLLSLVAKLTGYKPRHLTYFAADTHIYRNHLDQVQEQLSRTPYELPTLVLSDEPKNLFDFEPEHISLTNYKHHPPIKAEMAV